MSKTAQILGKEASNLLDHKCTTIDKSVLHQAGPNFLDSVFAQTNRSPQVLRSLEDLYSHG